MTVIKTGALESWNDGSATEGEEFLIGSGKKFDVWMQVAGSEAGDPTRTREASPCGKMRLGRRGLTGLSGRGVGKAAGSYRLTTGFSHLGIAITRLFPRNSMQVVDFPRLAHVRIFWGGHEIGFSGQATLGTDMGNGVLGCWSIGNEGGRKQRTQRRSYRARWGLWIYAGKITGFCAMFHESPRKFAQIRAVITRFCAFLRVGVILGQGSCETRKERRAQSCEKI
jgi:hypothetical protein